jgi:hypothetical protein
MLRSWYDGRRWGDDHGWELRGDRAEVNWDGAVLAIQGSGVSLATAGYINCLVEDSLAVKYSIYLGKYACI